MRKIMLMLTVALVTAFPAFGQGAKHMVLAPKNAAYSPPRPGTPHRCSLVIEYVTLDGAPEAQLILSRLNDDKAVNLSLFARGLNPIQPGKDYDANFAFGRGDDSVIRSATVRSVKGAKADQPGIIYVSADNEGDLLSLLASKDRLGVVVSDGPSANFSLIIPDNLGGAVDKLRKCPAAW